MKFRFFFLIAIFSLLYGALGANLYRLQIEKGAYYVSKVKAMEEINTELQLRRGQIFITDRSGTQIPVALNKDYPVIFVAPSEVSDPKIQHLIDNLIATCVDVQGVGIAAPQVYEDYRIFIVASHPNDRYELFPDLP